MKTKLLIVTALIESAAGMGLIVSPNFPLSLLLDTPGDPVIPRVAGVALLSLGLACCLARNEGDSRAGRALISAMLLYNVGVAGVLAYARMGMGVGGIALWPTVGLHAGMAFWCIISLSASPDIPLNDKSA